VKFFSQNRFTRAFLLLFANILDLCSNRRDMPLKTQKTVIPQL